MYRSYEDLEVWQRSVDEVTEISKMLQGLIASLRRGSKR